MRKVLLDPTKKQFHFPRARYKLGDSQSRKENQCWSRRSVGVLLGHRDKWMRRKGNRDSAGRCTPVSRMFGRFAIPADRSTGR